MLFSQNCSSWRSRFLFAVVFLAVGGGAWLGVFQNAIVVWIIKSLKQTICHKSGGVLVKKCMPSTGTELVREHRRVWALEPLFRLSRLPLRWGRFSAASNALNASPFFLCSQEPMAEQFRKLFGFLWENLYITPPPCGIYSWRIDWTGCRVPVNSHIWNEEHLLRPPRLPYCHPTIIRIFKVNGLVGFSFMILLKFRSHSCFLELLSVTFWDRIPSTDDVTL